MCVVSVQNQDWLKCESAVHREMHLLTHFACTAFFLLKFWQVSGVYKTEGKDAVCPPVSLTRN